MPVSVPTTSMSTVAAPTVVMPPALGGRSARHAVTGKSARYQAHHMTVRQWVDGARSWGGERGSASAECDTAPDVTREPTSAAVDQEVAHV